MKRITSPYISSKQKNIALVIAMIAYWLILLTLTSCRSAAPLISVPRNDSIVKRDRFVRDSIYVRDSIILRLPCPDPSDSNYSPPYEGGAGGGSVEHFRTIWRDRTVATTDTVYKDKEVLVQLPPERYVPWLYRVALYVCIALVLLIVIRICVRRFCGFR
jgi:hypothetical protein